MVHNDPYENLANAIILQAVKDFRRCAKKIKRGGVGLDTAMKEAKEIMAFFKSNWFKTLTNLDPDILIKKLREEVNE